MTKTFLGPVLLALLSYLFWLWRKEKRRKEIEKIEQLESQGYVPITMENADSDSVSRLARFSVRFAGSVALAVMIFLITIVAYFGVEEPMVRWILVGTLAVMGLIVLIYAFGHRRAGQRQ